MKDHPLFLDTVRTQLYSTKKVWLITLEQCPLFIAILSCEKNFKQQKHPSNRLRISLITLTFLKNLDNIQNKLIWQNAGIDLSQATKIVVIGNSLPQDDLEFKQLLSRMVPSDTKIEVVLTEHANPEGCDERTKYHTAGYRYTNFFGQR